MMRKKIWWVIVAKNSLKEGECNIDMLWDDNGNNEINENNDGNGNGQCCFREKNVSFTGACFHTF